MVPMRFIFTLSTILFTMVGCSQYYYAPNSHNVPLFKRNGEARFEATAVSGPPLGGAEFKGAVAVSNHVGVMANAFFNSANGLEGNVIAKGNFFEMGAGYFNLLKDSKSIFETYGGFGVGKIRNEDIAGSSGEGSEVKFSRFFVQPSIGFQKRPFEVALSMRLVGLNYGKITNTNSVINDPDFSLLEQTSIYFFIEPGFTIRLGWDEVKFHLQIVASEAVNNYPLPRANINLNFGLNFSIGKRRR